MTPRPRSCRVGGAQRNPPIRDGESLGGFRCAHPPYRDEPQSAPCPTTRPRSRSPPCRGPPGRSGSASPARRASPTAPWPSPRWPTAPSTLTSALDSDDTRVMVDSLRKLGIAVEHDPAASTIGVKGCRGAILVREADLLDRQLRDEPAIPRRDGRHRPRARTGSTARRGCASARRGPARRPSTASAPRPRSDLGTGCPPITVKASGLDGGLRLRQRRRLQPVPQRPADGRALLARHDHHRGRGHARLAAVCRR